MAVKLANKHLNNVREFIKHNLQLGYIHKEMTISELLAYIECVQKEYIPILEKIEKR